MTWRGSGDPNKVWEEPYWPQRNANYRPMMAPHRPRPHQVALSAPAPYAGGIRRPLMTPFPGPQSQLVPGPGAGAPVYGSAVGGGSVHRTAPWRHTAPEPQLLYQDFNAPARPADLEVTFECMSIECTVRWAHPFFPRESRLNYRYEVSVEGGSNNETLELPQWRVNMRLRVSPGTWYKVNVKAVAGRRIIAHGNVEFKSVFNRAELWNLHNKAVAFCGSQMARFELFYRNKPEPYWDNIRFNRNEVMEKYIKDSNGQAACPINDTIHGLFFSSNLLRSSTGPVLPAVSPFGNVRLKIPAEKLFNPRIKLYFADFYCTYSTHYVTVVGCIPGSETDRFCARSLIPLKIDDNVFLRILDNQGWFEYWVGGDGSRIWVEYFYTENVPLSFGEFNRVQSTGSSTPGGLHNNKSCTICNLYPISNPNSMASMGRKRPGDDSTDSARGAKRRRPEDEEDEGDYSDDEQFNSTFHLAMELERDRLGPDSLEAGNVEVLETVCALIDSVIPEVGKCLPMPEHGNVGIPAPSWIQSFKVETEKLRIELEESEKLESPKKEEIVRGKDGESIEKAGATTEGAVSSEAKEISDKIDETIAGSAEKPKVVDGVDKENMTREGVGVIELLKTENDDLDQKCQNLHKLLRSLQENLMAIEKRTKKR